MAARPDDHDDAVPEPEAFPAPGDDHGPAEADVPQAADPDLTDDERWATIVAQLTGPTGSSAGTHDAGPPSGPAVTYPVAPWVPDPRVVRPADEGRDVTPTGPPELTGRSWDGTSQMEDAEAADEVEEHFVAPDPGPVLGGDPLLTMAWFAAVGMPLFLLIVVVAWTSAPRPLVQAAGIVFVLGVAALVWRMPHRRDEADDDPGAVV
jgi:hypothetical protein